MELEANWDLVQSDLLYISSPQYAATWYHVASYAVSDPWCCHWRQQLGIQSKISSNSALRPTILKKGVSPFRAAVDDADQIWVAGAASVPTWRRTGSSRLKYLDSGAAQWLHAFSSCRRVASYSGLERHAGGGLTANS